MSTSPAAVVLATAGVVTAWGGFQAQLWGGTQFSKFIEYGDLRLEAARVEGQHDRVRAVEVSLFSAWLDAEAAGETALATYYRERFPPNLKRAFDHWRKLRPPGGGKPPGSPFQMDSYRPVDAAAKSLGEKARATFRVALEADRIAEGFGQGNVILAMSMFFAGIAQVFRVPRVQYVMVAVAALACILGVARVLTLPIQHPG
jgi:hypothetical protein